MTPEFAQAVDPIFLTVLRAWERIQMHADISHTALHTELLTGIREADDRLRSAGFQEARELARYALCAWIDDLMINRPWSGQHWWENNKLEFQLFNTNDAGTLFFQKAKQAQAIANRDAIEVFYIAVILGFKGLYAFPDANYMTTNFDLPASREEWTRRAATMLNTRPTRPAITGTAVPAQGAPPLDTKLTLVGALLCLLMLVVLSLFVGFWGLVAPPNQ